MLTLRDVLAAHDRIKHETHKTPVMTSRTVDRMTQCKVFFKCENFQRAGAFKFRGAFNAVSQLSDDEKRRGVITHSSGNHAQALALASSILGVKAVVVMPRNSSKIKIDATKGYGAEVLLCEPTLESRTETAQKLIDAHGYVMIHPYNNTRVIAGAGTAALELIQEVGPLDYVLAPVGGGGLLSGTAIATKGLCPKAKVIGAEPKNADDAYRSFKTRTLHPSVNPRTIADGLRTSLGDITFEIILEKVDDIATVSETEILAAMRILWERMKLVVEPSAAVPLAALLTIRDRTKGQRTGVILSGGNMDIDAFFQGYSQTIAKE